MAIVNNVPYYNRQGSQKRLGDRPLYKNQIETSPGVTRKYYSSVDAAISMNGILIDELVGISYQVTQNTMPLFGYNSYVYDDVAVGSRIISGEFTVNYVHSGYILDLVGKTTEENEESKDDTLWDVQHNPLWNKGLAIHVNFSGEDMDSTKKHILYGVRITGCSTVVSILSGEPIMESYTFMAQDLLTKDINTESTLSSAGLFITNASNAAQKMLNAIENSTTPIVDIMYEKVSLSFANSGTEERGAVTIDTTANKNIEIVSTSAVILQDIPGKYAIVTNGKTINITYLSREITKAIDELAKLNESLEFEVSVEYVYDNKKRNVTMQIDVPLD